MYHPKRHPSEVIIVGGGLEAWLTAAIIGHFVIKRGHESRCTVTLIEPTKILEPSEELKPQRLSLGEGGWPSLNLTLKMIGLDEELLLRRCRATLRQGARFLDWRAERHSYDHPLAIHPGFKKRRPLTWAARTMEPFDRLVSCQPELIDRNLSPKRLTDQPYQGLLSYGYHLDSTELAKLLAEHATTTLKVKRVEGKIEEVISDDQGELSALRLHSGEEIKGQFFVDCSGVDGLLIKRHCKSPWRSLKRVLFDNTIITSQAPYLQYEQPILSATYLTAWEGGWLWDMNLSHRRTLGVSYCDLLCTDKEARRALERYLFQSCGLSLSGARAAPTQLTRFEAGYLEKPWVRNCVAVGTTAGFAPPLESTGLLLTERAATRVAKSLTVRQIDLNEAAEDYELAFTEMWQEVAVFLKLHYALSRRPEAYWVAHQDPYTWPDELSEMISISKKSREARLNVSKLGWELFSLSSYFSVARGMGAQLSLSRGDQSGELEASALKALQNAKMTDERSLRRELPSNKALSRKYKR